MLTCKICKQRIQDGQVFAEINMTRLIRCTDDELQMDHCYDDEECIMHKECFLATINGCPAPDNQNELHPPAEVVTSQVQRTDPLEFFE